MTKFIARVGVAAALFAVSLGNYWYTFGLWPKSWASYVGFFVATVVCLGLNTAIDAEDK